MRRAALGAMPEAMLPHSVGGGLLKSGDTGAGKGWSAAQRRRRSGGTPHFELAQMMAYGMQSSAKRQIRLLVPQSTGGPPTATSTRLCEIAARSSDFRHAKPRKAGRKALQGRICQRSHATQRPAKGSLPLAGRDTLVARARRSRGRARSASADCPKSPYLLQSIHLDMRPLSRKHS